MRRIRRNTWLARSIGGAKDVTVSVLVLARVVGTVTVEVPFVAIVDIDGRESLFVI